MSTPSSPEKQSETGNAALDLTAESAIQGLSAWIDHVSTKASQVVEQTSTVQVVEQTSTVVNDGFETVSQLGTDAFETVSSFGDAAAGVAGDALGAVAEGLGSIL